VRIEVEVEAAVPRQAVWDVLTDWERQPDWMVDARSVHVLTPHREGQGVTIRCPTNLLGLTVQDVMRVTGWLEPSYLEVVHLGRIITGAGAFELEELGPHRTRIRWWERIDPPFGAAGRLGAELVVAPFTRRLFRRSLRNLADLAGRPVSGG